MKSPSSRHAALTVLLLSTAIRLGAQMPGDSVRFQDSLTHKWHEGRVLSTDSLHEQFVVRTTKADQTYRVTTVRKLYVWKRKSGALQVLLGATAGIVAWEMPLGQRDDGTVTGSEAADIAIGGGIGALGGLLIFALDPGDWHRVF
jgi:hypothetical protein